VEFHCAAHSIRRRLASLKTLTEALYLEGKQMKSPRVKFAAKSATKSATKFATKFAMSIAGAALLTTAAYAQTYEQTYDQAAPSAPYYGGSGEQPLYDVAVSPDPPGVVCVGGGIGYYPNPVAYSDSAASIDSGAEFTLGRGYQGCFVYPGE
jgi:hypothetical protein